MKYLHNKCFSTKVVLYILLIMCSGSVFALEKEIEATNVSQMSKEDMFKIFDGMYVVPRLDYFNTLQVDFYSDIALWYGILKKDKFREPSNWWTPLLDTSLVNPKAGWFGTPQDWFDVQSLASDSARTVMPIANFDDALVNPNGKASLTLFYNDPKTWIDAPQFMNLITVAGLAVEAASSVKSQEITMEVSDAFGVLKTIQKANAVLPELLSFLKVSCDIYALALNKITPQDCDQRFGNINTLITGINNTAISATLSNDTKIQQEIANFKNLLSLFKDKKTSKSLIFSRIFKALDNMRIDSAESIRISLIQYLLVEPILGKETTINSSLYTSKQIAQNFSTIGYIKGDNEIVKYFIAQMIMKGSNIQLIEASSILADFFHRVVNLRDSVINTDYKTLDAFARVVLDSLYSVLKYSLPNLAENVFKDAIIKNLGISKIASLVSVANQASAMASDYMTKPSIIHFNVEKVSDNPPQFKFIHAVPNFEVERYVSIKNESQNYLIDYYGISGNPLIRNQYIAYPTTIDPDGNHFLVKPGARADVDIKAYFDKDEAESVKRFISSGESHLLWHATKYPLGTTDITPKTYNGMCDDSFGLCFGQGKSSTYSSSKFLFEDPVQPTPYSNKLFLSYTNIFRQKTEGYIPENKPTELYHDTPGIYRDIGGFSMGNTKVPESDAYLNSFYVYVLRASFYSGDQKEFISQNIELIKSSEGNLLSIRVPTEHMDNTNLLVKTANGEWYDYPSINESRAFDFETCTYKNKQTTPEKKGDFIRFLIDKSIDLTGDLQFFIYDDILRAWFNKIKKFETCRDPSRNWSKLRELLTQNRLAPYVVSFTQNDVKTIGQWADIGFSLDRQKGIVNITPAKNFSITEVSAILTEPSKTIAGTQNQDGSFSLNIGTQLQPQKITLSITTKNDDILYTSVPIKETLEWNYPFRDVATTEWYAKSIVWLWEKGIIEGYKDGNFGVTKPITRAEFLKIAMLVKALAKGENIEGLKQTKYELQNSINSSFIDVGDHWAAHYIEEALKDEIIAGDPIKADGSRTFRPESPVARAEAAKIINNLFLKEGVSPLVPKPLPASNMSISTSFECPTTFSDLKQGQWYCHFVKNIVDKGIMKGSNNWGFSSLTFRPADALTRAEMALISCRAFAVYKNLNKALLCGD